MYIPCHLHSTFSLLDCSSKIPDIVKKLKEIGSPACVITDHMSVSGSVSFSKEMKKAGLKPILGMEMNVTLYPSSDKTRRDYYHLILLAKNKEGWKQLLKIISESNKPENFYYKARLDLDQINKILNNNSQIIAICGHIGSIFSYDLFGDSAKSISNQASVLLPNFLVHDYRENIIQRFEQLQSIFGSNNVFGEIQRVDIENLPVADFQSKIVRGIADTLNIPCVATGDPHYIDKADSHDHRVLLCVNLKTNFQQIEKQLLNDEDVSLGGFFRSNNYYIHSYDEMLKCNTKQELENTLKVAEMCEDYDITSPPITPPFPTPNGKNSLVFLTELCREGWKKKEKYIKEAIQDCKLTKEQYGERFYYELKVIEDANLADYFLIVWDICRFAREKKILRGPARGSAAGCLLSYLLDITDVDPLRYDLLFERFYSAGRANSLPDIDCDFQVSRRQEIIEYIKERYGRDKVAQVCTFNSLKGRTALREVLRINNVTTFDEICRITDHIPDEAKIADQLQEMRDEGDEDPSIIWWALENNTEELKQWCWINANNELEGPLCKYFEQAIRLENVLRNLSKHACAIAISDKPLHEIVPMIYDKGTGEEIVGFHKKDLEACGILKVDILGISLLDKLNYIKELLLQ